MVVEKPLTIDPPSTRQIAEAAEQSGRQVVVTHNYRYSPRNSGLKQIVKSNAIGTPLSVTFEWVLDTAHGADYFRRWHRDKANSGGLLVHKASHHFDLVNWLLADAPTQVYARGGVRFYGAESAAARGMAAAPERGTHDGEHSPWELDLRSDEALRELYYDNESHDGYRRDQNVFGPGVTTEDNLAVIVDYERGATLSYALNAHSPWEGYRIAVNGDRGARRTRGGRADRGAGRRRRQRRGRPQRPAGVRPRGPAASGSPCSATGRRPRTSRSRRARAATAAVTPCCSPTCSAVRARTGWNGRRTGWTASGPSPSAWPATNRCGPACR